MTLSQFDWLELLAWLAHSTASIILCDFGTLRYRNAFHTVPAVFCFILRFTFLLQGYYKEKIYLGIFIFSAFIILAKTFPLIQEVCAVVIQLPFFRPAAYE